MRILLVGYGKMGKAIEQIALNRGHEIAGRIGINNQDDIQKLNASNADVAIEFSTPEAGYQNNVTLIKAGIPVVCGTTGWLSHLPELESLIKEQQGRFFYASNFSIGVNIFFKVNQYLAEIMDGFDQYDASMREWHHIHKLDAPSGTAITLAEGIFNNVGRKDGYTLLPEKEESKVAIEAIREGEIPGTHEITYSSEIDNIKIKHTAHNRSGFATGAVVSAEWLFAQESGSFGMDDMLKL